MGQTDKQGQSAINALKEQRAKINAKIKKAQKAELAKQRRIEQKRHEIAGYVILAEAESNAELRAMIHALLRDKVTRPLERDLFNFTGKEEQEKPPADNNTTGGGD